MLNPKDIGKNEEQFEIYIDFRGVPKCQYDYRLEDGKLFSCVRNTLEECREVRDKYIESRKSKEGK